jgi:hypothetical protein
MTILAADALKTDPRGVALLEETFAPANGRRRRTPRFASSFACPAPRAQPAAPPPAVKPPAVLVEAL